jgi:CRISPR/Cas system CMR-associated protein Cmr3 (group 5 of RAMP superfamily)
LNEGCSKLLDQTKEAKLKWLQDPVEINGHNMNNVRRKTNRHIRNKKKEYMKEKINEIAMNSRIKNIRNLYRGIH